MQTCPARCNSAKCVSADALFYVSATLNKPNGYLPSFNPVKQGLVGGTQHSFMTRLFILQNVAAVKIRHFRALRLLWFLHFRTGDVSRSAE